MTLMEIADLIGSSEAEQLACGNYENRKHTMGYFIQIKCGEHWCRVSVSHVEDHCDRITIDELNSLDSKALPPATVSVPLDSIAEALGFAAERDIPVHKYLNSSDVEGVWAEFKHHDNWYMFSLSHVEVLEHAAPQAIDRMTDDFLWQQARLRTDRKKWPR